MSELSRYAKDPVIDASVKGRHYAKEFKLSSYTTFIVSLGFENRLDLIAYEFYNNASLWWVIAQANEISDPFDIPVGTELKIPSKDTLYGYKGILY